MIVDQAAFKVGKLMNLPKTPVMLGDKAQGWRDKWENEIDNFYYSLVAQVLSKFLTDDGLIDESGWEVGW